MFCLSFAKYKVYDFCAFQKTLTSIIEKKKHPRLTYPYEPLTLVSYDESQPSLSISHTENTKKTKR